MNHAAAAVANAISFEVKKDGMQQRQNGDWMLRFVAQAKDLQPVDIHDVIVSANMGTRFLLTLVQIGDDEQPVDHKAMDRDKWAALGATRQAGIRCKQPLFWAWMQEEMLIDVHGEDGAADAVRHLCFIESRRDLDKVGNTEARVLWHKLDFAFQAWKAKEHG